MLLNEMSSNKVFSFFFAIFFLISCSNHPFSQNDSLFNAQSAYKDIEKQLSFGPRFPGSPGHQKQIDWMASQLLKSGWEVELQHFNYRDTLLTNVIAKIGDSHPPILLGTHYDTRKYADRDPDLINRNKAVPGANDGASGVAVLLEIARLIEKKENNDSFYLVFFDGEDQGDMDGWDWIQGSIFYARSLQVLPREVIIIDMIGDENLSVYQEGFSNRSLQRQMWQKAHNLGYGEHFLPEIKFTIVDDHKPFVDLGIPSVLLIDLDYPYWHTVNDTLDKISKESLERTGTLLMEWLKSR